jgi:hypothetical protein
LPKLLNHPGGMSNDAGYRIKFAVPLEAAQDRKLAVMT